MCYACAPSTRSPLPRETTPLHQDPLSVPGRSGHSADGTGPLAAAPSEQSKASLPEATVELAHIAAQFRLQGPLIGGRPLGRGHIHDTYVLESRDSAGVHTYVAQRINRNIFRDVDQVMENIERVTAHLEAGLGDQEDRTRRVLRIVHTCDDRSWFEDERARAWRIYHHIGGTKTHSVVERPEQAYEAAKAFAQFVDRLRDLPGARLHETIPAFHDTTARVRALERAVASATAERLGSAGDWVSFALERRALAERLAPLAHSGKLPERVIHNDTKVNNVLYDERDDRALCVVDLDTVMPGLVHFDFGDLVRTAAIPCAEDSPDLAAVDLDREAFEALAAGYLDGSRHFLEDAECEHLAFSGQLLAYETGVRFLADHLAGDVYFKVHRPNHNLDRAAVQFRLVAILEALLPELDRVVARHRGRARGA